ncbi:FkbM family methyltransferase [Roseibium sp. HPY-6]|uniref:FkbM family methyltransferase n=1 Tax=Roseibium sp. HPY-6 TaxID=3229852 RepID=UPI0033900EEF
MAGNLLRFLAFFMRNVLLRNKKFIRLTPNKKGKVIFFSKKTKKIFSIHVRNGIDVYTADQIYTNQDYDIDFLERGAEIRKHYQDTVSNGGKCLIIDCGANIGLSARFLSEEFPLAKVVALEPDSRNFELAKKNCADKPNIDIRKCAIGSESGYVTIVNTDDFANAFRTEIHNSPDGIPLVTIEDIAKEFEGHKLFFVKVDIEGFEEDLFSKNTGWLDRTYLLVIELHDWMLPKEANSRNFLKVVSSKNRDFVYRRENIFSISNEIN